MRFESVNYRTRVWLNGHEIGTNTGAYIPFTMRLEGLHRKVVNRLVVRVDSRRLPTDFPPSGLSSTGNATGGWWNYGGILREVYLERLDTVSFNTVRVLPKVDCGACPATVDVTVALENVTRPRRGGSRRRRTSAAAGSRSARARLKAGKAAVYTRRFRVAKPRLWSTTSPYLYPVKITARSRRAGPSARTRCTAGCARSRSPTAACTSTASR